MAIRIIPTNNINEFPENYHDLFFSGESILIDENALSSGQIILSNSIQLNQEYILVDIVDEDFPKLKKFILNDGGKLVL